ncbi:MAG: hypothetical protein WAK17_07190 [Candidatus Nitrosopolaris sp.]
MTSITKNHKISTALVAIAVVAGVLVASTGSLHIVLAAHDVNVQTEINQKEYCKTDRANSPISDLCTARFSNTIIQSGRSEDTDTESAPTSTSTTHTTATHPTVLTINIAPNPVVRGQVVTVSGLLINTLSSSGVGGATIKFTGPLGKLVTSPDGSFSTSFTAATAGRSIIQAHYAGAGIYEPSDSVKITLFVT